MHSSHQHFCMYYVSMPIGSDCEARAAGDQIAPILPTNASRAPEGTKLASQEESEAEMYAEVIHPRLIVKSAEDSACFESVRPRLIKDQDNGRGNSALVTGALDKQAGPKCRKKPVPPPKPMKFLKFSSKDVINGEHMCMSMGCTFQNQEGSK